MASLNKVMIIGNLGRDPEVRAIQSGVKVANFSVATTERYSDREGQRQEKTEWHKVVMWRGLAEIAERYLRKGSQVFVEGKLQTRSWDDPQGQKRYTTEIVADNLVMLGSRSSGDGGGGMQGGYGSPQSQPSYSNAGAAPGQAPSGMVDMPPPPPEDDLPF